MSEREANERRKIKRGSISGLADTTMKIAASQEGRGPTESETQAAVPQQADASQEGQGPTGPPTGRSREGRPRPRKPRSPNRPTPHGKARDRRNRNRKPRQQAGFAGRPGTEGTGTESHPQQADASQEGQGPAEPETESHGPSTGRRFTGRPGPGRNRKPRSLNRPTLAGRPETGRTGDPSHGPSTGRRRRTVSWKRTPTVTVSG